MNKLLLCYKSIGSWLLLQKKNKEGLILSLAINQKCLVIGLLKTVIPSRDSAGLIFSSGEIDFVNFNCSIQDDSVHVLPEDVYAAIRCALNGVSGGSESDLDKYELLARFCRSLKAAIAPKTMLYLDLEDVRDLLNRGELALGYGRAKLGEGALVKACQLSFQCNSMMHRSDSSGVSGILVIINVPSRISLKLSEVRDGLQEIWRRNSETSKSWYTLVHEESAGDVIEVYLFMVRNSMLHASGNH